MFLETLIKLLLEQCRTLWGRFKHDVCVACLIQKCLRCSLMKLHMLLILAGFSTKKQSYYTCALTFSHSFITHHYVQFVCLYFSSFFVSERFFRVCFFINCGHWSEIIISLKRGSLCPNSVSRRKGVHLGVIPPEFTFSVVHKLAFS